MMKLTGCAALALACVALPASAAPTRVLGIDSNTVWDYSIIESGAVSNITFTESTVAGFASVNLNDYDVLVVSETFTDGSVTTVATDTLAALKAREADIAAWLAAGHGLVALSQPIGAGRWDWLPDAIQPTLSGSLIHDDTVRIVDTAHAVMQGLTDTSLNFWGTSSHGDIVSAPGLQTLVDDGSGRPITMAGSFGSGRVVLTLQDPDFHYYFGGRAGQAQFLGNAIGWVTPQGNNVPEPGTLVSMLAGLGALGFVRRRRAFKAG